MGNAAFEDAAADAAPSVLAAGTPSPAPVPELAPADSVLWVRHASGKVALVSAPTEMASRTKRVRMAGVLSKVRT
jgi:hypothetical protein